MATTVDHSAELQNRLEELQAELSVLRLSEETSRISLEAVRGDLADVCYALSHDLRGPLRSINGFSKALESEYGERLDDVALDYLRRAQLATIELAERLDGLLSMARVSQVDAVYEEVDITATAHSVITELEDAHPGRRVCAKVQSAMIAETDPRLVRLLLMNLLSNAWKFTACNQDASVTVSRDENGIFSVADNGVGFDMRYMDKLYKPFSKVHAPGEFAGAGIGLAIADRIVRRLGGAIWAEGRVGEGATFSFRLGPA